MAYFEGKSVILNEGRSFVLNDISQTILTKDGGPSYSAAGIPLRTHAERSVTLNTGDLPPDESNERTKMY